MPIQHKNTVRICINIKQNKMQIQIKIANRLSSAATGGSGTFGRPPMVQEGQPDDNRQR